MLKSFIIDRSSINMRIDRWIKINVATLPQGLIEKELRKGNIKLNKKKAKSSVKLKLNDVIIFYNFKYKLNKKISKIKYLPDIKTLKKNEKNIIENNDNYIIVNKDSGVPVQGGTKSKKNLIDTYSKSEIFKNIKPYIVHRLDKDTSGVLIIAKNRNFAQLFTSLFRLRKIYKTYLALCYGDINKNKDKLIHDLVRYDNKKKIIEKAITYFKVLDRNQNYTLLELKPITGRKHQLRKQLYEIGHPIVGDSKYNFHKTKHSIHNNLLLHSYNIKFMINNKKYSYKASIPEYFINFLKTKRIKLLNF